MLANELPALIGVMPVIVIIVVITIIQRMKEKEAEKEIERIVSEALIVTPQMKESLLQFPLENTLELRSMQPQELINLLSCCTNALAVFEKHEELISDGYCLYDKLIGNHYEPSFVKFMDSIFGSKGKEAHKKKKYASLKEKLDIHKDEVLATFEKDLMMEGSVLHIIPEKYRLSIILNMMSGYLSDGEVETWEGCIKSFKDDEHRITPNGELLILS